MHNDENSYIKKIYFSINALKFSFCRLYNFFNVTDKLLILQVLLKLLLDFALIWKENHEYITYCILHPLKNFRASFNYGKMSCIFTLSKVYFSIKSREFYALRFLANVLFCIFHQTHTHTHTFIRSIFTYSLWTCQPSDISWTDNTDIDFYSIGSPNIFRLSDIDIRSVFVCYVWRIPVTNNQSSYYLDFIDLCQCAETEFHIIDFMPRDLYTQNSDKIRHCRYYECVIMTEKITTEGQGTG